MTTDDRSTLSDDDEGISSDDMDEEDISRRAILRALMVRFRILRVQLDVFFFLVRLEMHRLHVVLLNE